MKKKFFGLFFIVFIVVLVIVGKNIIDNKTFKYESILEESLSSYMISGDTEVLNPVIELLNKYSNDEEIKKGIQSYSYSFLGSWYTYLDGKFLCDKNNLNSCKLQLSQFEDLNVRLQNLYNLKSDDGYSIIVTSAYSNLSSEGKKKIEGLKKIVDSPSAKDPVDVEEERQQKCAVAIDCESCRDGVCTCYYLDNDRNREELTCKKDIAN